MQQLEDADELRAHFTSKYPPNLSTGLEVEEEAVFTWAVTDWNELPEQVETESVELGGQQWRVLLFPQGSEGSRSSISLFLKRPPGETFEDKCIEFVIIMHNPSDPNTCMSQRVIKRYTTATTDWGYKSFTDLRAAMSASETGKPLIDNNATHITLILRIIKDPTGILWMEDFSNYNSRAQTGMVGLMNQGATCYLNSLLQSLYFTKLFRQTVYKIPECDEVVLSLQSLFYLLKSSPHPVSTLPLTRSFGWDTADAFTQHDVQELNRVLMDKLEGSLKGTEIEGFLNNIFVGQMRSYIKCVNVDFESARVEDFWDIQLNVKGMKDVYDSFDNYIEVEMLNGENQYSSSDYGLQDAEKGVIFEKLPPVLHLQLKRYDYDFMHDMEVKINDRYEFPMELDLTKYVANPGPEPLIYDLYGVLVHSGDLNAGHYYALIKPDIDSSWFLFDDDRVTKATEVEVRDENFGGPGRITSAYMLVYIQRSRAEFVLPENDEPVPQHICTHVESQQRQEEAARRERIEQQHTLAVHLLTNATFAGFDDIGLTKFKDFEENKIRLRRDIPLRDALPAIKEHLGLASLPNIWLANVGDYGQTIQLHLIADRYLDSPAESLMQWLNSSAPSLWVENKEGDPETQSLVYVKEFDGENLTLLGSKWAPKSAKATDIAGDLPLYLERRGQLEPFKEKPRLAQDLHMASGAILVIDKSGMAPQAIQDHYNSLNTRATITCYRKQALNPSGDASEDEDPNVGMVRVNAFATDSYGQLSTKIGAALGQTAENLIIYPYTYTRSYNYGGKWSMRPALRSDGQNLKDFWRNDGERNYNVLYDVLDQPLQVYERLAEVLIYWFPDGVIHDTTEPTALLVEKDKTVGEVLHQYLVTQIKAPATTAIKVWGTPDLRTILDSIEDLRIEKLANNCRNEIYAAAIPPSEGKLVATNGTADQPVKMVTVYHFSRDPRRSHSIPFKMPLSPGETLEYVKENLQKYTGLHGKTFEKVRITHEPHLGTSKHLTDNQEIVYDLIAEGDAIGLDHPDRHRSIIPQQSIVIK